MNTGAHAADIVLPFRLGFILCRLGVHPYGSSTVAYRGVDRAPDYPSPDELMSLRNSGQSPLAELWNEFATAVYKRRLDSALSTATMFRDRFARSGLDLDLIFASIEETPTDYSRYPHGSLWQSSLRNCLAARVDVHQATAQARPSEGFLGFDVSHPIPSFHSAIVQPGLFEIDPGARARLNENGLFDQRKEAAAIMERANTMDYGLLPFCVLAIYDASPKRR